MVPVDECEVKEQIRASLEICRDGIEACHNENAIEQVKKSDAQQQGQRRSFGEFSLERQADGEMSYIHGSDRSVSKAPIFRLIIVQDCHFLAFRS